MIIKLKEKYQKEVLPSMMKRFGYKNIMAVPRIKKVVLNAGFGRLIVAKTSEEQKKFLASITEDLSLITGQRPVLTKAKKSISSFKLRQGMFVGAKVVLRRKKMNDFLERLINVALPRVRDFRGIDLKSFDKKGNLTFAFKEQVAFPEVPPEKAKNVFGFELTVVSNAKSREEGMELLKLLGFPIKNN